MKRSLGGNHSRLGCSGEKSLVSIETQPRNVQHVASFYTECIKTAFEYKLTYEKNRFNGSRFVCRNAKIECENKVRVTLKLQCLKDAYFNLHGYTVHQ